MNHKVLFILVLLLALSVSPASAAPAPMLEYTPPQLAYIDAQLSVFLPHLHQFQASYHTGHGQYYQALASHSTPPDSITAPDGLTDHPTYQDADLGELWQAAALPYELGWSFSVSTYDGPSGQGYVLNVVTTIDGRVYQRAINTGPEDYREAPWYEFVEEE